MANQGKTCCQSKRGDSAVSPPSFLTVGDGGLRGGGGEGRRGPAARVAGMHDALVIQNFRHVYRGASSLRRTRHSLLSVHNILLIIIPGIVYEVIVYTESMAGRQRGVAVNLEHY